MVIGSRPRQVQFERGLTGSSTPLHSWTSTTWTNCRWPPPLAAAELLTDPEGNT